MAPPGPEVQDPPSDQVMAGPAAAAEEERDRTPPHLLEIPMDVAVTAGNMAVVVVAGKALPDLTQAVTQLAPDWAEMEGNMAEEGLRLGKAARLEAMRGRPPRRSPDSYLETFSRALCFQSNLARPALDAPAEAAPMATAALLQPLVMVAVADLLGPAGPLAVCPILPQMCIPGAAVAAEGFLGREGPEEAPTPVAAVAAAVLTSETAQGPTTETGRKTASR